MFSRSGVYLVAMPPLAHSTIQPVPAPFRKADYPSNQRQTPELPDYVLIDLTVPPEDRSPGKIVPAGFFIEQWPLEEC